MRWASSVVLVIALLMVACTTASESEVRERLLTTLAMADADNGLTSTPVTDASPAVVSPSPRPTTEVSRIDEQGSESESVASPTNTPHPRAIYRPKAREIKIVLEKDAIPAILNPIFLSVEEAIGVYHDDEPVLGVEINGEARAYSIPWLSRVEIVNDVVGGRKIAVTW